MNAMKVDNRAQIRLFALLNYLYCDSDEKHPVSVLVPLEISIRAGSSPVARTKNVGVMEFGRHSGLKIRRWKHHAGLIPVTHTTINLAGCDNW